MYDFDKHVHALNSLIISMVKANFPHHVRVCDKIKKNETLVIDHFTGVSKTIPMPKGASKIIREISCSLANVK